MTARSYMGTLNNPTESIQEYFQKFVGIARYICGQKERGTNGTEHFQFYVNCVTPQRLTALKKICSKAHFEKCRSDQASMDYCMKKDTRIEEPYELGEKPFHRNSKVDWEQIWESAKRGDIESIPAEVRIKHYRTLMAIQKDNLKMQETVDHTKGEWIVGKSGCGKSSTARRENPDAYIKSANKWWDGYKQQKVVLLDDLDKNHECLGHHLKIWADHYGCNLEIKGGQLPSNFTKFIVTSQYMPDEIFKDFAMVEAIMRRFKIRRIE